MSLRRISVVRLTIEAFKIGDIVEDIDNEHWPGLLEVIAVRRDSWICKVLSSKVSKQVDGEVFSYRPEEGNLTLVKRGVQSKLDKELKDILT